MINCCEHPYPFEVHGGTRTRNLEIRSLTRYPLRHTDTTPNAGLEPATTRLRVVRSTD